MPVEFLMAQMELRERVEAGRDAGDDAALDAARQRVVGEMKAEHARLAELIDVTGDYPAATALVRQLLFQEKLLHAIDEALDAVLN